MWHVSLLDLPGSKVMGTWAMGHMSIRGRVMGHMGDGNKGDRAHCHNV